MHPMHPQVIMMHPSAQGMPMLVQASQVPGQPFQQAAEAAEYPTEAAPEIAPTAGQFQYFYQKR